VRSAPNAEPAPPSCCRPATPKLCSFTSMRSQPKSRRALTLFSSSIKPDGMAPRPSRFQTTSRSCSSRHAHPNSTSKKISGNSCGRTGCRTEFSNPSTTSSITAATPGTRSSISRGKSCPSPAAIGQPQVTQFEDWYNYHSAALQPSLVHNPVLHNIDFHLGHGECCICHELGRYLTRKVGQSLPSTLSFRSPVVGLCRLSTKAQVEDGKPVTSTAQPNWASCSLG